MRDSAEMDEKSRNAIVPGQRGTVLSGLAAGNGGGLGDFYLALNAVPAVCKVPEREVKGFISSIGSPYRISPVQTPFAHKLAV